MNRIDYLGVSFAAVCIVFCYFGFSRIQSNTEDVLQWLPDQSEARSDYDFFESKFGSDDFLIVTWEDCRLGDERLDRFTEYLRSQDSTELIQKVTNGTEILERLKRDSDFSRKQILGRLSGVFFGASDPNLTCALIELSDIGTADRTASMNLVWGAIDADPELNREQVVMGGYPYIATFIDGQLKNSFFDFFVLFAKWDADTDRFYCGGGSGSDKYCVYSDLQYKIWRIDVNHPSAGFCAGDLGQYSSDSIRIGGDWRRPEIVVDWLAPLHRLGSDYCCGDVVADA